MSLRFAILGLLSNRPMSGYEVKKVIDASVGHFWTADQSQIYRTLAALVEDGLATRRTVPQDDRPNLHLHSITEAGTEALDVWLTSPPPPEPKREPFLARLFFADRLPPAAVRELLEGRRAEMLAQLAELESVEAPEEPTTVPELLRVATLDNGLQHVRAELAWVATVLSRLEGQA
ncbi:PadR family transcriptional regulator [Microbacterium lushaniae]|nr:PadR family transcriptional regulator [Microbacterium lushaniae]KAA9159135.1 PadR family transcriptional regulator [Microbacterium lushaniae]